MSKTEFAFWLHGWFEIQNPKVINAIQLQEIKNHLELVLKPASTPTPINPYLVDYFPIKRNPYLDDRRIYC